MPAKNVGVNSTFEEQRVVINEIAIDVDNLLSTSETDPVFSASAAFGIAANDINQWNTAYGWGDHSVAGYVTEAGVGTDGSINTSGIITAASFVGDGSGLTGVIGSGSGVIILDDGSTIGTAGTINFGSNLSVSAISAGVVTVTASGGGSVGTAGTWAVSASGIHTSKNVGINTVNPTSALSVVGDGLFSGIVTATRFESSTAGTPTLDSPNNLNINAVVVAISTDLSVGDTLSVTGGVTVSGITTSEEFRTNTIVGDGSDRGFSTRYYITANGTSAYRFAGPGVLNSTDNPTLYLHRGFTYIFENSTGSNHPFALRVSAGGADYSPGGSFLTGSQTGTQILTVPFDAPSSIVYQCTIHTVSMVGTINFVS